MVIVDTKIMSEIYKIKDNWLKNAKVNKEEYEKMYNEINH